MLNPDSQERAIWKRSHVFGTNHPVTNDTRKSLAEVYRKRWNIETSYRVEKHEFLAETTSKSYKFRLFLFLVAVVLYDFWMILRLKMGDKFYVRRWKISLYFILCFLSDPSLRIMEISERKVAGF